MKKIILTVTISIITVLNGFSTEQIPDLLIIDNDTIYLKSFPLEKLEFKNPPFKYGEYPFSSTACWRGYQAVWTIENDSLFLIAFIRDDSTKTRLDIEKYFRENNYEYKKKDGKILADWYSANLEDYFKTFNPRYHGYNNKVYLFDPTRKSKKKKILMIIKSGRIIENKIKNAT